MDGRHSWHLLFHTDGLPPNSRYESTLNLIVGSSEADHLNLSCLLSRDYIKTNFTNGSLSCRLLIIHETSRSPARPTSKPVSAVFGSISVYRMSSRAQ